MAKKGGKNIFGPDTLSGALQGGKKHRLLKTFGVLAGGAALFVLYMVVSVWVLGKDLPKTAVLRRQNADWQSRLEQMGARLDRDEEVMSLLEVRVMTKTAIRYDIMRI